MLLWSLQTGVSFSAPHFLLQFHLITVKYKKIVYKYKNHIFYFPRWKQLPEKKRRKKVENRKTVLLRRELWYWVGRAKTTQPTNHFEKTGRKQKLHMSNLRFKTLLSCLVSFWKIKPNFTKINSSSSGEDSGGNNGGGGGGRGSGRSQRARNALF